MGRHRVNDDERRPSTDESGRQVRVAGLWAVATDVWGGEGVPVPPVPAAGGAPPIDVVLGSDLGARLVEDILGRLRHGSAA